jgi:hypothetical protein
MHFRRQSSFVRRMTFDPPKSAQKAQKGLKGPFLCGGLPMMVALVDLESPR